jgi:NAD(P)-dependent dehydrogenase (short-subunit alcohol dehydrogenase family)
MKIAESTALVTGANRGIGKAFTEELLARGAGRVYAGVRGGASLDDPRLVAVDLDVTRPERVQEVAAELTDVDLLINNAGTGRGATPLGLDLDGAREDLETNFLGIVSMTQAFAPVLAANGGTIVNNLSAASWVALPTAITYSASKAAAWSYTNATRIELRAQGVKVIGVYAGFVDTRLTAAMDIPKLAPREVAVTALDGVEAGSEEIMVDEFARNVKAGLGDDLRLVYPSLEAQAEGREG